MPSPCAVHLHPSPPRNRIARATPSSPPPIPISPSSGPNSSSVRHEIPVTRMRTACDSSPSISPVGMIRHSHPRLNSSVPIPMVTTGQPPRVAQSSHLARRDFRSRWIGVSLAVSGGRAGELQRSLLQERGACAQAQCCSDRTGVLRSLQRYECDTKGSEG